MAIRTVNVAPLRLEPTANPRGIALDVDHGLDEAISLCALAQWIGIASKHIEKCNFAAQAHEVVRKRIADVEDAGQATGWVRSVGRHPLTRRRR